MSKKKKKQKKLMPRNPFVISARSLNAGKLKNKKDKRAEENHNKDWSEGDY